MAKTNFPGGWKPLSIAPVNPVVPGSAHGQHAGGKGQRHVIGDGIGTGDNEVWRGEPPQHSDDQRASNPVWQGERSSETWTGEQPRSPVTEKPSDIGNASRWTTSDVHAILDSEIKSTRYDDE